MSRYEAAQEEFTGQWFIERTKPWDRLGFDHSDGGQFTEAEAKIIAWALNTVAEGGMLFVARNPDGLGWQFGEHYDGPTEGVAP